MMDDEAKVCVTCKWNKKDDRGEWACSNKDSESYGNNTFIDDRCEEWEEKE